MIVKHTVRNMTSMDSWIMCVMISSTDQEDHNDEFI